MMNIVVVVPQTKNIAGIGGYLFVWGGKYWDKSSGLENTGINPLVWKIWELFWFGKYGIYIMVCD